MRPAPLAVALAALAGFHPLAATAAPEPPVPREWLTPAEAAEFRSTPSYEETLAFLRKLEAKLPEMRLSFYGTSAEGRPMPVVVVSKERAFAPASDGSPARERRPVVLIQNGIHAGEIDGKDASLMILRDLALGRRRELLDAATLLILPIYNVDGHERISPYNRPNQNGPEAGMGFRTTASGLDINRDSLKLASAEARALAGLFNAWRPDLHVDDHVTDGIDMAWVLTYAWAEAPQAPPAVGIWLAAHMPAVVAATVAAGHPSGPYVDLKDHNDPAQGFSSWVALPRYSTGYYPLRNRPSILVEMHSYKPYRERVLANRDFLLALLAEIGKDPAALRRAVVESEKRTVALGRRDSPPSEVVLRWEESPEADTVRLPVFAGAVATSVVTGQPLLRFRRGEPAPVDVPWFHRSRAALSLPRPRGYLVLPGWPQIAERLRGQGLRVETLTAPAELDVEAMRLSEPTFAKSSYQGLTQLTCKVARADERRLIPAGALWVPADQPDFEVAVQLLEPEAPDSLVSWGLLSSVFERKEWIEPRVLESLAEDLLKDPVVAADWQKALADEAFAKDPDARTLWWYRRTPYWDGRIGLLPIFRVLVPQAMPTQVSSSTPSPVGQ